MYPPPTNICVGFLAPEASLLKAGFSALQKQNPPPERITKSECIQTALCLLAIQSMELNGMIRNPKGVAVHVVILSKSYPNGDREERLKNIRQILGKKPDEPPRMFNTRFA